MTDDVQSSELDRYVRQMRYAPIGEEGQRKIVESRILICGCGALGTVLANTLVRAGVGFVRIVDRDFIELNNLQRQVLFDEQDIADQLPKAIAAANKLRRINSTVEIESVVADVDHTNVRSLAEDVDLLVDGTDNFETRFLLNDLAHALGKPWLYGGCIGAEGQTMTIVPGETACLRCVVNDAPPPGTTPTCDTAGILGSAVNIVASIQAAEALKLLSGNRDAINRHLTIVDLWDNRLRQVKLDTLRETGCPTCKSDDYPWLSGSKGSHSAVLCGRNAVQLNHLSDSGLALDVLAKKLEGVGEVRYNDFLLRLAVDDYLLTIFPDGRAIVGGTDDVATARTVYARYIGN
ncbi:MAG: ThiF family adenylyltransferase [Pirellulales bacterium]|nr:ThiF family adenylyltransferase [Pirellulales bacterium]